jgi:hypothetical protein
MSSKRAIYRKGHIEGQWTAVRWEVLDSSAWKNMSLGARLLYIALLRNLGFKQYNNGKLFLATRTASKKLGVSQRIVCVWFRELEHYGFIVTTEPGTIGPKGRATRWRITDHGWGELDGKPITPTKDYLKWDGVPFTRGPQKQKNGEQKYSPRVPKVLTHDDRKYSGARPTDDRKCSEGQTPNREQKYSDLVQPSPTAAGPRISHNAGPPLEPVPVGLVPVGDGLDIPEFLRRALN